ncbi:RsmB/NOP family class I SAM-dependent RNA methyltransferase [Nibricoccus sp. IMCC34717]|uniref:RsmB/NOP family class I SAM-dependent RNA methyltransferase n=1 Tax=Nibricoccus sp. IMCC34717 TaxID=3034021 RepID=UPI0038505A01
MSLSDSVSRLTPWSLAVQLLARWIEENARADALLESLPREIVGRERARCQHLFFGALRHKGRVEALLRGLIERAPRPRLTAVLLVSGFELIEGGEDGHAARVVHHAVEQTKTLASASEARLVNAVVRKLAAALAQQTAPGKFATAETLSDYFSHPGWLVSRWLAQYGAAATRQLLEWNQTPAPFYGRWRGEAEPSDVERSGLKPTRWPGMFEVAAGHWQAVEASVREGRLYIQDPSTLFAVELAVPGAGETFLDACAAPGGKTLAVADRCGVAAGKLVAMDLPGARQDRLRENVAKARGCSITVVAGDIADPAGRALEAAGVPTAYDSVLLDVPCSNTGVMRHRVDVRWRLRPDDIAKHARQQLSLLKAAARRVGPAGRLVYSTCSLDREENEAVIESFLADGGQGFRLTRQTVSLPWESGCDGAGAFLLTRQTH